VGRKLKSPTRTISNSGEYPRFIGNFPCTKAAESYIPFDSLSSLMCGIWLEWRKDVTKIEFEPRKYSFEATDTLPAMVLIPDYSCTMDTGEIGHVEAKYSHFDLRPKEAQRLAWAEAHFKNAGLFYEVVYRKTLEEDGFVQSILLLRPYGRLSTPTHVLDHALVKLQSFKPDTLTGWRANANKAGIPTGILYQLLYQQRLAFIPEPLTIMELRQWQD
jgi:hypothetical protein